MSSELGTAGQFGEKRRRHGVFLWGQMVGVRPRVSSELGTAGQFGEKRRRQGDLSLGSNGEGVI